jgi:hypothetical protein
MNVDPKTIARNTAKNLAQKYGTPVPTVRSCKVWEDGNFTVALINGKFVGVAKRNPKMDRPNRLTGYSFAIARAIKKMFS